MKQPLDQLPSRRGTVFAYVAPMLFALFGLAALVIDLGNARLTQRRMQSAADAAAVEALRGRDDPAITASQRDTTRRQAASTFVAAFFAVIPPQPELSGDIAIAGTSFRASQLIQGGDPIVYNQGLKLNLDNEQSGDVVSGTFAGSPDLAHAEKSDYSREDFTPGAAGDLGGNAVLVRLRLTGETLDQDGTSGPPVPILFGRGSLLNAQTKADGLKVRAASIATATAAWSIGPANPALVLEGYTPVAIRQDFWQTWQMKQPLAVTVSADGTLAASGGQHVGSVLLTTGKAISLGLAMAGLLADANAVQQLPALLASDPQQRYFLYAPISANINGTDRVIGFGRMQAQMDSGGNLVLTKLPGMIAPRNASPRLSQEVALNVLDLQAILQANAALQKQEPVLTAQTAR